MNLKVRAFKRRFVELTRRTYVKQAATAFGNVTKCFYSLHDLPPKKKNAFVLDFVRKYCPEKRYNVLLKPWVCALCCGALKVTGKEEIATL